MNQTQRACLASGSKLSEHPVIDGCLSRLKTGELNISAVLMCRSVVGIRHDRSHGDDDFRKLRTASTNSFGRSTYEKCPAPGISSNRAS